MRLSTTRPVVHARFDDENLIASAGLVPVVKLAQAASLHELADERLTVQTDKGANAALKVASLVAGMAVGADSIDDMALLRHAAMPRLFRGIREDRPAFVTGAALAPAAVATWPGRAAQNPGMLRRRWTPIAVRLRARNPVAVHL